MSRKSKKKAPRKNDDAGHSIAQASGAWQNAWFADSTNRMVCGVCLLLAVITWLVFGWTIGYDFLPYDDNAYVYENLQVTRGLGLKSIFWAFTHSDLGLWTPLTTLSHMLDCQIFGLHPWGHHLVNVLLHISTAILLFLVLRQMTGALWRCAFVAAVFAIHPLRVESVAWISERKDVLSGLFFMLTLAAYLRFVRARSPRRYMGVVLMFVLGLLSKQMLVTLPFLLLLLDYWPLNRFASESDSGRTLLQDIIHLSAEKIPLFALSFMSCIETFIQRRPVIGPAMPVIHDSWLRVCNAFVTYVTYVAQTFYPAKLVVLYPFPSTVPMWQVIGALCLLAGISIAAYFWRRKYPSFLVGWLWYLGMLVPVVGFIQLGKEGHADRYTYLPQIGLCIIVAWAAERISAKWRFRREILGGVSVAVIAALAWCASVQTSYWRDGETLWRRTLACIPGNGIACNYLGYALLVQGREEEAIAQFKKSLEIMPRYAEPENNLGIALFQQGDVDKAIVHFIRALEFDPRHVEARSNLALALIQKGFLDDAAAQLQRVIEFQPDRADAYSNLGNVLLQKGDVDGAIDQFKKSLQINPDYVDGLGNLGNALLQKGEPREAVAEYQKALEIMPQNATVQINMARVLATSPDASVRNGNAAVVLALQADELSGGKNPAVLDTLAAAYAEAGRFSEAIETTLRALELAGTANNAELVKNLQAHLALYRANSPLRMPLKKTPAR